MLFYEPKRFWGKSDSKESLTNESKSWSVMYHYDATQQRPIHNEIKFEKDVGTAWLTDIDRQNDSNTVQYQ